MIGLVGAHRVGKTTLAREVAKIADIPFVETGISAIYAEMKLDPAEPMHFSVRLAVQREILQRLVGQWSTAQARHGLFVTDRTPMDLAAYTLADIRGDTTIGLPDSVYAAVDRYVAECIAASSRLFMELVLVQPGIAIDPAPGKARACPLYIEHLNYLIMGLMGDARLSTSRRSLPRTMTDLHSRTKACFKVVQDARLKLSEHSIPKVCH